MEVGDGSAAGAGKGGINRAPATGGIRTSAYVGREVVSAIWIRGRCRRRIDWLNRLLAELQMHL
jgi:hypothetical protein